MTANTTTSDYVIIGSGANGTSIAHALATLGCSVTVLDRSDDGFVASDGASNDLNKIVRADYTDANYCTLAKEAISRWRTSPLLSKYYHEVGVLFRSDNSESAQEYVQAGLEHAHLARDKHLEIAAAKGERLKRTAFKVETDAQVGEILGERLVAKVGEGVKGFGHGQQVGYFNPRGGWADANNACRALLAHAITLGVKVVGNATVVELIYSSDRRGKVVGVKTNDGRTFQANNLIVAAGAWTRDLLCTLTRVNEMQQWMTRPSAQCVAVLKLTPQEARELKDSPVIISFSNGFYLFEPTPATGGGEGWEIKIAIHSNGYLYPTPSLQCTGTYPTFSASTLPPGTGTSANVDVDVGFDMATACIPASHLDTMLAELARVYPHLADAWRVKTTRVCWYSDTLDENWIIDNNHPSLPDNVWVVSGDSGHAYKFLPILGDLFCTIANLLPNTRNIDLKRFSFAHQANLHKRKQQGIPVHSADSNRAKNNNNINTRARL